MICAVWVFACFS